MVSEFAFLMRTSDKGCWAKTESGVLFSSKVSKEDKLDMKRFNKETIGMYRRDTKPNEHTQKRYNLDIWLSYKK